MTIDQIVSLAVLIVVTLGMIATIIVSVVNGEFKKFIIEKMAEAEEKYKDLPKPEKSQKKLQYVIDATKEKYKIMSLILNVTKIVETIIDVSKRINSK